MKQWTKQELETHIKANTNDLYSSAVIAAALYKKLFGEFPKIGLTGFQAEGADSILQRWPTPAPKDGGEELDDLALADWERVKHFPQFANNRSYSTHYVLGFMSGYRAASPDAGLVAREWERKAIEYFNRGLQLEANVAALREALEFYANRHHLKLNESLLKDTAIIWDAPGLIGHPYLIGSEMGQRARQALAAYREKGGG